MEQQPQQQQQQEEQKLPTNSKPLFLYAWGLGAEGQLGSGGTENIKIPYQVKLENVIEIAAGGQYSAAVTKNGELYMMGSNKRFKMGVGDENNYTVPIKVKLDVKIRNVACGDWHTVICDTNGNCYGAGYNKAGCLGLNHNNDSKQFTKIPLETPIIQISCGRNITLFITNEQQLLSAGCKAMNGNSLGNDQNQVRAIKGLESQKIVGCSAGFSCCACVGLEGQLYTWGFGTDFQLGHGNKNDIKEPKLVEYFQTQKLQIIQVSCTRSDKHCHMGCIDKEGFCYTWGSAYKGKLGHGKTWSHSQKLKELTLPKKIDFLQKIPIAQYFTGGIHSAVLTKEGQLMTFGCGSDGRLGHPEIGSHKYLYKEPYPKVVMEFEGDFVVQAASSYYHMVALVQKK